MRQVVVHGTLDEFDARPPTTFPGLVEACVTSAEKLLANSAEMQQLTACPACGSERFEEAFFKHGYRYGHCLDCWSLCASPRLSDDQQDWYLHSSPAADYRRSPQYVDEISLRMEDLAAYQANWVSEIAALVEGQRRIVHFEPRGYQLLEQLQQRGLGTLAAANPLPPAEPRHSQPAIEVYSHSAEIPSESVGVAAAFDVFEHQNNPAAMLGEACRLLVPGGFLMLTTRSGSGFDIQTLWEHADVFPVEHVNLFTVEGMRRSLEASGFDVLEISTPGFLDLQIIRRVVGQTEGIRIPRFLQYFLEHRDVHSADRLQEFLQSQRLSSHMRVLARKRQ